MNANNFLDSPLRRAAPKDIPVTPAADLLCPTDIYQVSPLARVVNPSGMTILPISMQSIEEIGKGLTTDVMKVTERFVSSMPLVDADELGDLVARFNTEVGKLELKDRTGIVGWSRSRENVLFAKGNTVIVHNGGLSYVVLDKGTDVHKEIVEKARRAII